MDRRQFVRVCTSIAAAATARPVVPYAAEAEFKIYPPSMLVDGQGITLKASSLAEDTNLVFHYPYAGTPALLLRLSKSLQPGVKLSTAKHTNYRWPGGVGPGGRIVAFSAICPHQLSAVFKSKTFISYRPNVSKVAGRANTIVCCAHHSVYDPSQGGKVVSGPAPQPLTAIVLRHDIQDRLFAVGTLGGELFDDYFKAYRRELIDEFGRGAAKQATAGTCTVYRLEEYTQSIIDC